MPATSQQQQKLMGLVHALQKGTVKPGQASKKAQQMAKSMKKSDVTDFAATKHKGLPKKAKKENMGVASMYVVRKPHSDMNEADLVMELNPLEGIEPLNINMADVHSVHASAEDAQEIAAEAYRKCMDEALQLEQKKGKVGDKIKKAIDQLEKKRKEHMDMAKEDPKQASKHKEHIAKIAQQIDDLMTKMEKIEKSKKEIKKDEEKKSVKESILEEAPISLPAGLDVYINKKGEYILFGGEEGEVKGPFSEYENMAKTMRSFISQLPDGKMIDDIEIYGGLEGLELMAKFTTSLSREEVEKWTIMRKTGI
jgi:hypothetical protein